MKGLPRCGIVSPVGQLEDKVRLVGTGVHELLVYEPACRCTCAPEPKRQRYWSKTLPRLTMESLTVNAFEEVQWILQQLNLWRKTAAGPRKKRERLVFITAACLLRPSCSASSFSQLYPPIPLTRINTEARQHSSWSSVKSEFLQRTLHRERPLVLQHWLSRRGGIHNRL